LNSSWVKPAGPYSLFAAIYPGPHLDHKTGKIDERIRFAISCGINDEGAAVYLVFPFAAEDQEIKELVVSQDEWTD